MEDWLSQLDMDWNNEDMNINNDLFIMPYDQSQQEVDTFNEELALILGDEVPSPLYEERTLPKVASSLSISTEQLSPPNCDAVLNDNNVNVPEQDPNLLEPQSNKNSKQKDGNGKRKRKREPNQIYDHIMAERKRRELLGQLFIALSAILPGLKKVDKTSILGEAIKQMKHLKEKVKTLEETVEKQNVESMVMVKRSKMVVDNDDDSSCIVEDSYTSGGIGGGGGGGDDNISDSLPEIEVKVSNKTLLLRVYCEKRKGISAKILGEVEKHNTIVLHSSMMPFGSSGCNVTIVGQTEKTDKKHVKNLVKGLHSILHAAP